MEDLRDFEIMRKDLMTFKTFDHFADNISTFMAENLIRTTDFLMNPIKKKQLQKQFINPELCEITEHLVYTEPYIDFKKQNILTKGNEEFIHNFVYNDKELHIKVAKLKQQFLTQGQALLHGDLHTGSIFINEKALKVIDPEFAFYGPIGYDVGNLVANLTFSWLRALAFNESAYVHWIEEALVETMEKFEFKSRAILKESSEQFTVYEEVVEEFLASVLRDTFAIAGLEMNRRIIGLAKVADITTINHKEARILAERRGLSIAKECIKNEAITSISRYMQLLLKYKGEVLV